MVDITNLRCEAGGRGVGRSFARLNRSSNFFVVARRHQKPRFSCLGLQWNILNTFELQNFVFQQRSKQSTDPSFCYNLYGLTPNFRTCSVNSRTTCPNLGPSAAETHSSRKRSSSIPKSASISLMASARFSVL